MLTIHRKLDYNDVRSILRRGQVSDGLIKHDYHAATTFSIALPVPKCQAMYYGRIGYPRQLNIIDLESRRCSKMTSGRAYSHICQLLSDLSSYCLQYVLRIQIGKVVTIELCPLHSFIHGIGHLCSTLTLSPF